MKHKKDISDLIRENQHKLNERPSPRAWRRLESKLDNQHSRHQTSVYKQFAMVAAVIALVAVASLITMTIGTQNDMMAEAKAPSSSFATPVQELETDYTDANEDLHKVVEFQRSLKRIYASNPNPIAEGTQRNKVIAANETPVDNNTLTILKSNERVLAMKDAKPSANRTPSFNSNGQYSRELKEEKIVSDHSAGTHISTNAGGRTDFSADVIAASKPAPVVIEEESYDVADIEKNILKETIASNSKIEASPVPPAMTKAKKNITKEWYHGLWKYDNDLNRDEKFNIIHNNEKTYLVVVKPKSKKIIFELTSSDNNRVTFTNIDGENQGYNIRIENGKFLIYKNDQDYGLLIEKIK